MSLRTSALELNRILEATRAELWSTAPVLRPVTQPRALPPLPVIPVPPRRVRAARATQASAKYRTRNYAKSEATQKAIQMFLHNMPSATIYELSWAIGVSENSIRYQLRKLEAAGLVALVRKPRRGQFRLRAVSLGR
jgi:DNA-binding transcriptional ArsR family regulator